MTFDDKKFSVYDSDIDHAKLDLAIAKNPFLKYLKYFGEVVVFAKGNSKTEDGRFSAPYQDQTVIGGSKYQVVDSLKLMWSPDEKDIEALENESKHGDMPSEEFETFKKTVLAEPRKTLSYDISEVISAKAIEKIIESIEEDLD